MRATKSQDMSYFTPVLVETVVRLIALSHRPVVYSSHIIHDQRISPAASWDVKTAIQWPRWKLAKLYHNAI